MIIQKIHFRLLGILLLLFLFGGDHCGEGDFTKLLRGFRSENSRCSHLKLDQGSVESPASPSVSLQKPNSNRTIWVDDEVSKRTYTITTVGSQLECSRDAGTTYSSCDSSTSIIWNVSDYNQLHIVKSTNSIGEVATESFTPSTDFPGVTFVTCTSEESGTNSEFDQFTAAYLGSSNQVICISNGVTISNSIPILDEELAIGGDNITIIVREGQTGTFSTTRGSGTSNQQSIFTATGRTGIKLIGLTLTSDTGGASWLVRADSATQDLKIIDSILTNSSSAGSAYLVYITGNSGSTTPVSLSGSTVTVGNGKMGSFVSSGTLSVSNSTIVTEGTGIRVSIGSTATIADSVVTCSDTGTSDYAFYNFRGTLSLDNVTTYDGCGNGAIIVDDNNFSTATVNIENSLFVRTSNITGNTSAALVALNGGSSNVINSTGNNNRICNQSGSTEDFTAVSSGTFGGSWSDGNQLNGGVLADCP